MPPANGPGCAVRVRRCRLVDGSEIRARDRIGGRHGVVPEPKLSRHLEKRASLRGCHVSLLLPASFTIERQVEHDLIPVGEAGRPVHRSRAWSSRALRHPRITRWK